VPRRRERFGMKRAWVFCLLLIFGLGVGSFAQTLTGSWGTAVAISASPVTVGIDSELVVNYSLETWSFGLDTVLDETGWTRQSFAASGTLGQLALASRLALAPSTPLAFFSQWTTTGTVTLDGITTIGTFSLTPGNVQVVLDASGSIGDVGVRAVVTLGDTTPAGECDFGWQGVDITVDVPFCCGEIKSVLSVDCSGFEELTFKVEDIGIPTISWLTLDALLTFTPDEKSLVVSPSLNFDVDACFSAYVGMGGDDNVLFPNFTLNGIGLTCSIGGIQFTGQSYWGTGSKPSLLTGTPYWEAYQIATTNDECCGPLDFDVTVYFLQGGLGLFDVGEVAANLSIDLAAGFTFTTGLSIELTSPTSVSWTLAFLVEW
jgi:hypothetical protein